MRPATCLAILLCATAGCSDVVLIPAKPAKPAYQYTPPPPPVERPPEKPTVYLRPTADWKEQAFEEGVAAVTMQLKTPGSAKFFPEEPAVTANYDPNTDESMMILHGTVDAQNLYGALVRNVFTVTWKMKGNPKTLGTSNWKIDRVKFY